MDFPSFIRTLFKAIKEKDQRILRPVYSDWIGSSEAVASHEEFISLAMTDLEALATLRLIRTESFDGFHIAYLAEEGSERSVVFKEKGDSFVFFNERSGYSAFKRAYAFSYSVSGGIVRFLFNGKRSPFVTDAESVSGFVSLINSALIPGRNTLKVVALSGSPSVSLRISSGPKDGIMDTSSGDALSSDDATGKALIFDAP